MYSLTLISILCILMCVGIQHADSSENVCTTKPRYCKLDIDPKLFTKGAKGERGDVGYVGLIGEKGNSGHTGEPGVQGRQGSKGEKGDMASKGEKGDDPQSTIVGLPGPPGVPGIYQPSSNEEEMLTDFSCETDESGKKRPIKVGPAKKNFDVYCGLNPRELCIPKKSSPRPMYNYKEKKDAFWISEIGIDSKELYNLTDVQIDWLKENASYIRQTLRYYCNNSKPYSAHDITKSIRLLTWNDIVVGPYPTDVTPLFYSVPTELDGCSKQGSDPEYTDIILQTTFVNRLPIIDVQINDVRNEPQSFRIEHIELCFAVFYLENNINMI